MIVPATYDGHEIIDTSRGRLSVLETITRDALKILTSHGMKLQYFTVALRDEEFQYKSDAPEVCHLRVRWDPEKSERTGEKALGREMRDFGDLSEARFESVVQKQTGQSYYKRE